MWQTLVHHVAIMLEAQQASFVLDLTKNILAFFYSVIPEYP